MSCCFYFLFRSTYYTVRQRRDLGWKLRYSIVIIHGLGKGNGKERKDTTCTRKGVWGVFVCWDATPHTCFGAGGGRPPFFSCIPSVLYIAPLERRLQGLNRKFWIALGRSTGSWERGHTDLIAWDTTVWLACCVDRHDRRWHFLNYITTVESLNSLLESCEDSCLLFAFLPLLPITDDDDDGNKIIRGPPFVVGYHLAV